MRKLQLEEREILRLLEKGNVKTFNEIAKTMGYNRQTINKYVHSLRDKGYIEKIESPRRKPESKKDYISLEKVRVLKTEEEI